MPVGAGLVLSVPGLPLLAHRSAVKGRFSSVARCSPVSRLLAHNDVTCQCTCISTLCFERVLGLVFLRTSSCCDEDNGHR